LRVSIGSLPASRAWFGQPRESELARARLHYKVSCQRNDFLHHLSSELTKTKSVIVLEDLERRRDEAGHAPGSLGWGCRARRAPSSDHLQERVVRSTADRGRPLLPSTQLCSGCGVLNPTKGLQGLGERTFRCPACGFELDRDENAAINLRAYGLKRLQLSEGLRKVTPVEKKALVSDLLDETKPASAKQEATARRPQHLGVTTRIGSGKPLPALLASGNNSPT
jgi:Putative transposase DNA-binding domain